MNGTITTLLNCAVSKSGAQNRFNQTSANLAVNGFLFDCKFTVPANYTGKWDFLKEFYVNITKRIGAGNGGAVALLSNVSLYDILSYSDFVAGVSMISTSFEYGRDFANYVCIWHICFVSNIQSYFESVSRSH